MRFFNLKKDKSRSDTTIRVDFSLRREIFFVVVGSMVGAGILVIPKTIFETSMGIPYYISWIVFGQAIGVYSENIDSFSSSIIAGIFIHILTAISIGIIVGIFLYKTGILNISKPSNGLFYGIFAGIIVFLVFFIPVNQFILEPNTITTLSTIDKSISPQEISQQISQNINNILIGSFITHIIFGITLGTVTSFLSIKFGSKYRCIYCDISFSRIDSYQKHIQLVHGQKPIQLTKILILGGGFAGIEILTKLQNSFQTDIGIDITLVSKDNFFLFTPMLPEVVSGNIETRHIATPVRSFCHRARFYEAEVESIDLYQKKVIVHHNIGKESEPIDFKSHSLDYDYLVLCMGGETNFFGNSEIENVAFTIKNLGDSILLRNHIINMLEQADIEHEDSNLKSSLLTFVVVGGGFSGVETIGELNDFIRHSIKHYYHNISENDIRVVLINSRNRILPEVTDELADFALQKLKKNDIEVILNTKVTSASKNNITLSNDQVISSYTLIWAGGVKAAPFISNLNCSHDKSGRIIADSDLYVNTTNTDDHNINSAFNSENILALGDCASIIDPNTGNPYPPTAQHAIRQAKIAAYNIISDINSRKKHNNLNKQNIKNRHKTFNYKTKGIMALIGNKNGVGILFGHKIQGFLAWWLWHYYYLGQLPTTEKKIRVLIDWTISLFFKPDVTRLKTFEGKRKHFSLLMDKNKH
ncbi:MAG: NAD(P)/FAD-dependent oxidoreductase [Nitrososphaeraceae archaeon]